MTINSQTRTAGPFAGTGAIVAYPFTFKVFQARDLRVVVVDATGVQTDSVLTVGHTVTLNADQNASPGGTVTPLIAIAVGSSLRITSALQILQPASLTNSGGFYPQVIEDALDRLTILMQEQGFVSSLQTLRVPDLAGVPVLASAVDRANKVLGFDADGDPIATLPASGSATELAIDLAGSSGAGLVGYGVQTVEAKLDERLSVADKGGIVGGVVDATAAFQAAHDALPATGGTIEVPEGEWLLATTAVYVNITKPNVTIVGGSNSWIVSPDSANAEIKTGTSILNGFNVTADNFTLSCNMRGPLVLWTSGGANHRLTCRDMTFKNLYNAAFSINTTAFDLLDIDGVTFDTSRDLTADGGNYSMINRGGNGTMANHVRVNRCLFRGVSGGIDAHDVKLVSIGGGTRFEGVDINAVKVTSYNLLQGEDMRIEVDSTTVFDGTPINSGSANRHLSATGLGRTAPGTMYAGFIQVFTSVRWHAKHYNFPNSAVSFRDGSNTNATLNMDLAEFDDCPIAIQGLQGDISIREAKFVRSNIVADNVDSYKDLLITGCRAIDSYFGISKKMALGASGEFGKVEISRNNMTYGVDNLGAIRYENFGVDSAIPARIEYNDIGLTGAQTVGIDGSSTGTRALVDYNVMRAAAGTATVTGGASRSAWTQVAGTFAFLPTLDGTTTLNNTGATGSVTWTFRDDLAAAFPVGTSFHVQRTAAFPLIINVGTGGSTVNGAISVTLGSTYAACKMTKTSATTWVAGPFSGTVTTP